MMSAQAARAPRTFPVLDARAAAVATRLHALDRGQFGSILAHYLPRLLANRLFGRPYEQVDADFLRDKLVAIDPDKAEFCYQLCRAHGARWVVEVGTSFGVSTLYLASAVRDAGGGLVIGTEIEPSKAEAARRNFAEAGIGRYVELRVGDALETLKDCGGEVDFALIDTWIPLARPALELLMPQLAPGAIVLCDNVRQFEKEYADYLALVRDPASGFISRCLPFRGGLELSVWRPRERAAG